MSKKRISLEYKNKKTDIQIKECNSLERLRGLMFRSKEKSSALIFNFKKNVKIPIHSFFVFFDFIVIWLDEKDKIIDVKKIKPFRLCILPKKPFKKIVEIPLNAKYKKEINSLFLRDNLNKKFLVDD